MVIGVALPLEATAQSIPSTADTGRIEVPEFNTLPYEGGSNIQMPRPPKASKPPAQQELRKMAQRRGKPLADA